jgi:ABC-2 type transport system ATP-binding protein
VPAVAARGIRKTYRAAFGREQVALAGIDLTIERGAAFGLIGPNGAGKTTFIKVLLGIVRADAGELTVLDGDPEEPATRARIGYLPERLHLPHSLTPIAFLASVARLKGLGRIDEQILQKLVRVGLDDDRTRAIGTFSKGMKQRLGLAAALLGEPELLILDEPTDGVDPMGRVAIRALLSEERARGATLLLNSHLLSETEKVCDRVGVLARGRVVRTGPIDELRRGSSRYRVRFEMAAPTESALGEIGFRAADDGQSFICEASTPELLNQRLDQARRAGAMLVELTPELRDLEDVLTEALTP